MGGIQGTAETPGEGHQASVSGALESGGAQWVISQPLNTWSRVSDWAPSGPAASLEPYRLHAGALTCFWGWAGGCPLQGSHVGLLGDLKVGVTAELRAQCLMPQNAQNLLLARWVRPDVRKCIESP